jgi:hypothetical protein
VRWQSAVVLVLVLAGLGGYYAYDTWQLEPAREKREAGRGRLWEVEAKDIEALTLARKGEKIRLKRAGEGWELLEPVRAPADRGVVDGLVANLVTLRSDQEVHAQPPRPADFGLDPPEAVVTLEVKGRPGPLGVEIGARTPTGVWVYARRAATTAVLTVSEVAARDASRPLIDFRDKTVLAFERRNVSGLELTVEGAPIRLEAKDGTWQITEPRPLPADGDLVGDVLDKLERARAREFVADGPTALAPYGLDRPSTIAVVVGKDKDRATKTLRVGKLDPAKKGVYVMREGEPAVMLVPEELWQAVPKTVAALRDKVVLRYAWDKARKLELSHGRGTVTLERQGAAWKITAPEALPADTGAVNGLLWAVRDLKATAFLAEEPAALARYLPRPEVTVRVWEEGGGAPRVVLVGSARGVGGPDKAVAAVQGQGPVVLVSATAAEDLVKTADDLRDKTLLPGLEPAEVKRARLVGGGKTLVVERRGDGDWRVVEPAAGPTKEGKVNDLVFALRAARWKGIVSPSGAEAARYGLEPPALELTLSRADGREIATLQLGAQEGNLSYVRVKSGPAVYTVENQLLGDLRRALGEIPG